MLHNAQYYANLTSSQSVAMAQPAIFTACICVLNSKLRGTKIGVKFNKTD